MDRPGAALQAQRRGAAPAGPGRGLGCAAVLGLGLAACAPMVELAPAATPPPAARPAVAQVAPGASVRAHFERQEAVLRGRGLMRTDTDAADVPFGVATLVRNFDRIALRNEYVFEGERLVGRESAALLRRWEAPVRLGLEFGAAVDPDRRAADTRLVRDYVRRLAAISGHPMELASDGVNFHVLVVTEDERRALAPRLQALVPGIDPVTVNTITDLPLSVSCLVVAFARPGSQAYSRAIAVVRAELPDLTRASCFHEEIAQGMGLPNDSAAARPSIFNDTMEFALLTRHDEALLRILYDPRLTLGMTAAEARPIVETIAVEILAPGS